MRSHARSAATFHVTLPYAHTGTKAFAQPWGNRLRSYVMCRTGSGEQAGKGYVESASSTAIALPCAHAVRAPEGPSPKGSLTDCTSDMISAALQL
eukprot:6075144-Prymnesium_polylepis.2